MIFSSEDSGFGAGQEPSGYLKIEVKDGKGRLSLSVSNLKEDYGIIGYKLYVIKFDNRQCVPVCIGDLTVNRNKSEMAWEFDPQNVNSSQLPIDEFNIAAVVAKDSRKHSDELVCPLVAYKGEKIKWKDKAKGLINPVKPNQAAANKNTSINQDVFSKYQGNITSKYTELDKFDKSIHKMNTGVPDSGKADTENKVDADNKVDTDNKVNAHEVNDMGSLKEEQAEESAPGKSNEINPDEDYSNMNNGSIPEENKAYDLCENCPAKNINDYTDNKAPDLNKLKEVFSRYFETFDPFRSGGKKYSWWRVDNPTSLNNILYGFNLKNPLLFNPRVLMAYYKYRHLAVGIFDEITGDRKYIVCGIPAVYGVDDRAFGAACKWGQTEGGRVRYGSFGYWLVYLDAKTGRIIN